MSVSVGGCQRCPRCGKMTLRCDLVTENNKNYQLFWCENSASGLLRRPCGYTKKMKVKV